jgi:hypothetical protein
MQIPNQYSHLNFERFALPGRLILVVISAIAFMIVWRVINHSLLFCLGLPTFAILVWFASYGWRPALLTIINFLGRLINL